MFPTALQLTTPLTIGNKAGTGGVAFIDGLNAPAVLPEFVRKRKVTLHGSNAPAGDGFEGRRIIDAYKTDVNHWDVEWEAGPISPLQKTALEALASTGDDNNPGYVVFTLGGTSPTYYLGILAEDYPVITDYRYNMRACFKVEIKIHVLSVSSVTSITLA